MYWIILLAFYDAAVDAYETILLWRRRIFWPAEQDGAIDVAFAVADDSRDQPGRNQPIEANLSDAGEEAAIGTVHGY